MLEFEFDESYYDDVGGYHDPPMGWSPMGNFCGECTRGDCSECIIWKQPASKED